MIVIPQIINSSENDINNDKISEFVYFGFISSFLKGEEPFLALPKRRLLSI